MIFRAPAKINLGLHVKNKRDDGFHELESIFHAIPLYDYVELIPSKEDVFHSYNLPIPGDPYSNLCLKALELVRRYGHKVPFFEIHLLKNIPIGAGLGGGSSDAVAVLMAINDTQNLQLTYEQLSTYAAELGSDCPFFLLDTPALVTGRGEKIKSSDFNLGGYYLHLVYPNIHISTAEAYGSLDIDNTSKGKLILPTDEEQWSACFKNDFEESLWPAHPELKAIKQDLISSGAFYSSLSGSGSSVFGVFKSKPTQLLYRDQYSEWILEIA